MAEQGEAWGRAALASTLGDPQQLPAFGDGAAGLAGEREGQHPPQHWVMRPCCSVGAGGAASPRLTDLGHPKIINGGIAARGRQWK